MTCLCGRAGDYARCCGRALQDGIPAADAEALMRSRYCAYVLGDEPYLLATWHASTRPRSLGLKAEPQPTWLGLKVLRHAQQDGDHAVVEFVARYKIGGRICRLQETSRFVREAGCWYYLDGTVADR